MKKGLIRAFGSTVLAVMISGCGGKGVSHSMTTGVPAARLPGVSSAEKPVAAEKNPLGDIPDTQTFVKYASPQGGYQLEVPEGWAGTESGMDVAFSFDYDGLSVTLRQTSGQPDTTSILANQAQELKKTGRAVTLTGVESASLSGVQAVRLSYECNSEPNPVTNKQIRLENETYFFYKNHRLAALRLWAPLGADNVDQWKRIAGSFQWK